MRTRVDGMPDVVAVATRQDRGTVSRALTGSTSAAVARNCPTATLIVRSRAGPNSPAAGAELPEGTAQRSGGPATGAPSKVTEGAALAVTATLAAAAARAAAAEAEKRVALEVAAASGGDEQAEKARTGGFPHLR